MKRLLLISVCLLLFGLPAMAQTTINFAWDYDATEATKITGFHAWQTKQSGNYSGPLVGTFPNTALTGSLPAPGYGKWCWVWTAYFDDTGTIIESPNSNEVCTTIKPKAPKLISAIQTALAAPVKAITYMAGLFKGKKQLRIVE